MQRYFKIKNYTRNGEIQDNSGCIKSSCNKESSSSGQNTYQCRSECTFKSGLSCEFAFEISKAEQAENSNYRGIEQSRIGMHSEYICRQRNNSSCYICQADIACALTGAMDIR